MGADGFGTIDGASVRARINGDAVEVRATGAPNGYILRVTPKLVTSGTAAVPAGCDPTQTDATAADYCTAPAVAGGKGVLKGTVVTDYADVKITFDLSGLVGVSGGALFLQTVPGGGAERPEITDTFKVVLDE